MGTPSPTAETTALRAAYAALNRNDMPGFLRLFDAQVERVEPAGLPGSGTCRGLDALRAHAELHRGRWAEGACEPVAFLVAGERVVACVHVRVRLQDESAWREGRVGDAFTFRGGRVVAWRTYVDEAEARAWIGPDAAAAG